MAVCSAVEIWSSFQEHLARTVGAQRRPNLEPDLRHHLGGSKRNYGDANRRRPTSRADFPASSRRRPKLTEPRGHDVGDGHASTLARAACLVRDGMNDGSDRATADGRVVLIFEERHMRRAVRRLMGAVRREGCQLVLGSGPSRLLPKIGSQDEEWLPIEARERLVLAEDGF